MSYILEALKKAQSERQLGHAPTIHDMPIQPVQYERAAGNRTPLWIALALGAALVVGGVVWWRMAAPPVQIALAPSAPLPVPSEPMPAPAPVPMPPEAAPAPAPVASKPFPEQAPMAAPPKPFPVQAPMAAPPKPTPAPAPKPVPVPVPAPVPEPRVAKLPAAPAEPAAVEESLPSMRELPQSVQQGLPQVAFGGYMYSKNPADRLLLIDKVLRHEGEEVAPGLVLEKLLPKAAVMNYRGTRYRVPF